MAPKKGVKRGSLREQTKELLILEFFLSTNAKKATADEIKKAWDPGNPHSLGGVFAKGIGPRDQFLSRAGADKICKRLAADGLLTRKPEIGYRNKKVFFYSLATDEEGFFKVTNKMKNAINLLLESEYGKKYIDAYLVPRIEKNLVLKLPGNLKKSVVWVFTHSPTAFAVAIDDSLGSGEISILKSKEERLHSFLDVLRYAITVDRSTKNRGRLIIADERASDMISALAYE